MTYTHIHFVGIKGVGMTPLAIIAKQAGCVVTGSDIAETYITDKSLSRVGITPFVGFSPEHVQGSDLVITTGAHRGFQNPEVVAAKKQNIPVWTQGQAVGEFMKGEMFEHLYKGISVAGTHGKTTTTGMLATIFMHAGKDPAYLIGTSEIASLDLPGHFGKGKYFIAEADEYATEPTVDKTPKFLWQHPEIAVITNVDFDHPDIYHSINEVIHAFEKFIQNIQNGGVLIANGDDPYIQKLLQTYTKKVITYGKENHNDAVIINVTVSEGKTVFGLQFEDKKEMITISVIGEHNAYNATAAFLVALQSGLTVEQIKEGLLLFKGSKRRTEFINKLSSGALLFDDYAHHPTEITKTLSAVKQAYKGKKLVCIFQPHTFSRTKQLFDEFASAFTAADEVVITDIYASLRENPDDTVSSDRLVEKIKHYHANISYCPTLSDVVTFIKQKNYDTNCVIVTMGAGDIYKIKESLSFV